MSLSGKTLLKMLVERNKLRSSVNSGSFVKFFWNCKGEIEREREAEECLRGRELSERESQWPVTTLEAKTFTEKWPKMDDRRRTSKPLCTEKCSLREFKKPLQKKNGKCLLCQVYLLDVDLPHQCPTQLHKTIS